MDPNKLLVFSFNSIWGISLFFISLFPFLNELNKFNNAYMWITLFPVLLLLTLAATNMWVLYREQILRRSPYESSGCCL